MGVQIASVHGWRAYTLGFVPSSTEPYTGRWYLSGMYGRPMTQNPSEHALCLQWIGFSYAENGEHMAPCEGCSCGYYGLFRPDPSRVPGSLIVWSEVDALGKTLISEESGLEGFKAERVRVRRLFWPCTTRSLQHLYWPNHRVPNLKFGAYLLNYDEEDTLERILPPIAGELGVELVYEPLASWLERRSGIVEWPIEDAGD